MKHIDTEKMAAAIEADAGQPLDDLRASIEEMKAGKHGRTHLIAALTPEQSKDLVKTARKATGLSQSKFAAKIYTSVRTLQGWEHGRFSLTGANLFAMEAIIKHPEIINE